MVKYIQYGIRNKIPDEIPKIMVERNREPIRSWCLGCLQVMQRTEHVIPCERLLQSRDDGVRMALLKEFRLILKLKFVERCEIYLFI